MRSYCQLWTHVVFSTKHRNPIILPEHEIEIHQYMFGQLKKQECIPIVINGTTDHLHLLFSANYKKSLMEIMRDVKGGTSYWANSNRLMPHKLEWQDGFGAFSVSHDHVDRVTQYILNQKRHHKMQSHEEEVNEMITKYGLTTFG